ncbi:hypothetical protein EDD18DRAFT_1140453, partial [Armillaria luteobubalina]
MLVLSLTALVISPGAHISDGSTVSCSLFRVGTLAPLHASRLSTPLCWTVRAQTSRDVDGAALPPQRSLCAFPLTALTSL